MIHDKLSARIMRELSHCVHTVAVQAMHPVPYFDSQVKHTEPERYSPTLQLVQLVAWSEQVLQLLLHAGAISVPDS